MRHTNYTLSPTRINNAKPQAKPYKLTDGGGLYLLIIPSGAKSWRYQYKLGGARGEVSIGKFPEIGVADARDRHFECRFGIRMRSLSESKGLVLSNSSCMAHLNNSFKLASRRLIVVSLNSRCSRRWRMYWRK